MKEVRKNKLEQFNYSIFMDWFKKNQNPLKWELKNKLIELRSEFDPLNIIEYEIFVSFNFQKTKQDIKRKINLIWELAYQMDFKILTSELNEIMKVAKKNWLYTKLYYILDTQNRRTYDLPFIPFKGIIIENKEKK